MKNFQTVGCALIWNEKAELLISKRKSEDSWGGYWEFPGGKQENFETIQECIAREIKEELNVLVSVRDFFEILVSDWGEKRFELHFYDCLYLSGKIQAIEVADYAWATPAKLSDYLFLPANGPLILKIQKRGKPAILSS